MSLKLENTGGKSFEELFDTSIYDNSCIGCEWLNSIGSIDNPTHFECYGDLSEPKRKIKTYNSCQLWCKYTSKWTGPVGVNQK